MDYRPNATAASVQGQPIAADQATRFQAHLPGKGSSKTLLMVMPVVHRVTYAGLLLGSVVAALVWTSHQAGWLVSFDGSLYNQVASLLTGLRSHTPQVLIVRADSESELDGTNALALLEAAARSGAREVVFASVPQTAPRQFFNTAVQRGNVVFGRKLRPDAENPETVRLEKMPMAATNLQIITAAVFVRPASSSTYRSQQSYVPSGADMVPTLEKRVALLRNPTKAKQLSKPFLISFVGPPGRMPVLPVSRVLAGDLIPILAENKLILIGTDNSPVGLRTPVGGRTELMSFLEYQANALQTVLEGSAARPLSGEGCLVLLLVCGIPAAWYYQRLSSFRGLRLLLPLGLALGAAATASLAFCRVWLPLGPLLLEQFLLLALCAKIKSWAEHKFLQELRVRSFRLVKQRSCPEPVCASVCWEKVDTLIRQVLPLERQLFLQRIPGTDRLQESASFNCRFEDLVETDRSLKASFVVAALANEGLVKLPNLMKQGKPEEEHYVCGLKDGGESIGVWVLSVNGVERSADSAWSNTILQLAQEIATLVAHAAPSTSPRSQFKRLHNWCAHEPSYPNLEELKRALHALERQHQMLENVLTAATPAVLVYDRFGAQVYSNEPAARLLGPENFALKRESVGVLLRLLTGGDEAIARQTLRRVILERTPVSFSAKLASLKDRQLLVRLSSLDASPTSGGLPDSCPAMLVCELIDTTMFATLAHLKGVVGERLAIELRDHLAAIEVSASLLGYGLLSAEDNRSVIAAIHQKAASCVHVISECEKYLARRVDADGIECHPLDALEVLSEVMSQVGSKAAERRVRLVAIRPQLMGPVLASKPELTESFHNIFQLLLDDAAENSQLRIEVETDVESSTFRFTNSGFGIPDERLQDILSSPELPVSWEFQTLREAQRWARHWKGALEIKTGVGVGYQVALQLRQFQVVSFLSPARGQTD